MAEKKKKGLFEGFYDGVKKAIPQPVKDFIAPVAKPVINYVAPTIKKIDTKIDQGVQGIKNVTTPKPAKPPRPPKKDNHNGGNGKVTTKKTDAVNYKQGNYISKEMQEKVEKVNKVIDEEVNA